MFGKKKKNSGNYGNYDNFGGYSDGSYNSRDCGGYSDGGYNSGGYGGYSDSGSGYGTGTDSSGYNTGGYSDSRDNGSYGGYGSSTDSSGYNTGGCDNFDCYSGGSYGRDPAPRTPTRRKKKGTFGKTLVVAAAGVAAVCVITSLFGSSTSSKPSTSSTSSSAQTYEWTSQTETEYTLPTEAPSENYDALVAAADYRYFGQKLTGRARTAYAVIADGVSTHEASISLTVTGPDELRSAIDAVFWDYPEYFWFKGGWNGTYIESGGMRFYTVEPNYEYSASEYKSCADLVESVFQPQIDALQGLSEYDKVKGVYEFLINYTRYDLSYHGKTVYELARDGAAVCEGYTRATQYMLTKLGVEAIYVSGDTVGGGDEGHAWNIVKINGKYYQVDTTWGDVEDSDGTESLTYKYLCMTDDEIGIDHIADNNGYPACVSTDLNWYRLNNRYLEYYDERQIASCIGSYGVETEFQCATDALYEEVMDQLVNHDGIWNIAEIVFGTRYDIHNRYRNDPKLRTFSLYYYQ